MKAWSQNLGHENPLTTFTSYVILDPYRQGELIKGLMNGEAKGQAVQEILEFVRQQKREFHNKLWVFHQAREKFQAWAGIKASAKA